MPLQLDDQAGDQFAEESGPIVQPLVEDDPLASFASEHDDADEQGILVAPVSQSPSATERYTPVLTPEADLIRSTPDEPLRLTLVPATVRVDRGARRAAVAAAAIAIVAAGAYFYPAKDAPTAGPIARTAPAPRELPGIEEEAVAAPAVQPERSAPESHTDAPSPKIAESSPRNSNPTSAVDEEVTSEASSLPVAAVAPAADADDGSMEGLLSGDWVMHTRVESSRLERYEGLRLGYRVTLRQRGNRISGSGWKVSEDERKIGTAARTPITFDGTLNDDRLELTFTERGRRRVTVGKLVLARHSDNAMQGRFSSIAAQSLGVVEIYR